MEKKITVLSGDGIGPEIIEQAIKVLKAIAKKYNHKFVFTKALIGACAIDKTGEPLPQETLDLCKNSDAVLLGAIGHPDYDNNPTAKVRPEQGLLKLRKELGLYANIRPVNVYESLINKSPLKNDRIKGVDFVVVRELISGIYFGEPRGRSECGNTAFDTCKYSRYEIERILKIAFEYANNRNKRLTVVDKANVLATSRLWREIAKEYEQKNPAIAIDYMFVDNAAMQIITNPAKFDVVVTGNMFGDILTDEASVITGSLGLLPSASIGDTISLYEPIHGSYPQAAGKNIANPLATILSAALMLDISFDMKKESEEIKNAVNQSIINNIVTEDIDKKQAKSTAEVGDWVAGYIFKSSYK